MDEDEYRRNAIDLLHALRIALMVIAVCCMLLVFYFYFPPVAVTLHNLFPDWIPAPKNFPQLGG